MDTNNQNVIIIIVCVLCVLCVFCCLISSASTLIFNLLGNKAVSNVSTGGNESTGNGGNIGGNGGNAGDTIVTPVPKIKFCSLPNLGGTCKTYDLSYKFYPFDQSCGPDDIGFKPQSAIIENDDPAKYKLNLKGYQGNPGDTHCGPGLVPLNATPNCYNSNIYGINGDRGSCISDIASGVNWTMNNTIGGIEITRSN